MMFQKKMIELSSSKRINVYVPNHQNSETLLIYVLDGEKLTSRLLHIFQNYPDTQQPVFVSLSGENRLREYTPWPAPALSERFESFGGEGDAFVAWLTQELKPCVENQLLQQPASTRSLLLGYSLGGLLAVYASFLTDAFSIVISISGSFWYPEWDTFVQNHIPASPYTGYLMLCGRKEGTKKKNLQKNALERTVLTHQCLCQHTDIFPLLIDEGGHHDQLNERLEKAAAWIRKKY